MVNHGYAASLPGQPPRTSPTDLSVFVRLHQCERYLRLRLHERNVNPHLFRDEGVDPVPIPPLLTRSGAIFEHAVTTGIAAQYPVLDCTPAGDDEWGGVDNARVVETARSLSREEAVVLVQARLSLVMNGWDVRGHVDLLRLERDADGHVHILIADMKSSAEARVEHRLQVAFYAEMLDALFAGEAFVYEIQIGVLYRGGTEKEDPEIVAARYDAAERLFGTRAGLLEVVEDAEPYRRSVRDLVTGDDSRARRIVEASFDDIPFHLESKCDGCFFNEICMKWSGVHDDLSLIPHLTIGEKEALRRHDICTVQDLAVLREPEADDRITLVPAAGQEALNAAVSSTWPVGPRLDELVHRARRYRRSQGDDMAALSYIPSKGYGSLPYVDATQNPNLIRIFLDAQYDFLVNRIWLLGARVVACEGGVLHPRRQRTIVHMADGVPDEERERDLFVRWTRDILRAVVELAAPDAIGEPSAPIHLIFYDKNEQKVLLEGLARHFGAIFGATPLYDFMTQMAAFDSPIATYLSEEIRELRNYPILCQSLHAVAAITRFDWNAGPVAYSTLFRQRLFDSRAHLDPTDDTTPWYTRRARFDSRIPLEYAYAAWDELDPPPVGKTDELAPYRAVSSPDIVGFQARRLDALEHITMTFKGNKQTTKRAFQLPDLATFTEKARSLADAMDEFVMIERLVEIGAWKAERLAPPERRLLSGITLIGAYDPAVQEPGVRDCCEDIARRAALAEQYERAWRAAHPEAEYAELTREQKQETAIKQQGLRVRLNLVINEEDCTLDHALTLTTLKPGDGVVVFPRWTTDSRLPVAEQQSFQPTARQLLHGGRATIAEINAQEGYLILAMRDQFGGASRPGFVFSARPRPFLPGEEYTLDPDPDSWYAAFCASITDGLRTGGANALYDRIATASPMTADWPVAAQQGQAQFLAGLDALHADGVLHDFEAGKRDYIGQYGDAPVLLVQGPPGTGKSYTTAFAVFARLQGAMAAGMPFRVFVSCKTHAATDVLLKDIATIRTALAVFREECPTIFAAYFDDRLLTVPLYRMSPKDPILPDGVTALEKASRKPYATDIIVRDAWNVTATTPGGVYRMTKDRWGKQMFGNQLCDCLILDEASQMNLPEAALAALLLKTGGQLVVVGDHRQMPPIIKHDWETEPRRTFAQYRSYESLFLTLMALAPPMVKFAESFRLHADMAAFLRREIYAKDGIPYFSRQQKTLAAHVTGDPFVDAVLDPHYPIIVVVHGEERSQTRNRFEQLLITPVLETLAAPPFDLGPVDGLGVVVPHRAQRAALRESIPALTLRDANGTIMLSAVDTVERFQGGERDVILVSATESDLAYLLVAGDFLLDPRRLTVALSRARTKMILVASRSIFTLFSADEETFANAQLWKDLRYRTCCERLWRGERQGVAVQVFGNAATPVLETLRS